MVFTDTKPKKNQIYSHWFYFGLSLRRLIFHDLLFLHVICLKFHSDWCQKPSSISVTLFLLVGLQLALFFIMPTALGKKDTLKIRIAFVYFLIIYSWIDRVLAHDDITLKGGNFPRGDRKWKVYIYWLEIFTTYTFHSRW